MDTNMTDNKSLNSSKPSSALDSFKKSVGKISDPLTEKIAESAEELKADTIKAYDSSIQVVRANPIASLAIATGVGVILGMFLKRRH